VVTKLTELDTTPPTNVVHACKGKGKCGFVVSTPLRRSGMTRGLRGVLKLILPFACRISLVMDAGLAWLSERNVQTMRANRTCNNV